MKQSLPAKLSFWISVILILFFSVIISLLSWRAMNDLRDSLDNTASSAVQVLTSGLDSVFLQAELSANLLVSELERAQPAKDEVVDFISRMAASTNKQCPYITGLAIAYCDGALVKDERYNAFITFVKENGSQSLTHWNDKNIVEYFDMEWYLVPITLQKPLWTVPFKAAAQAGNVMLVSYAIPFNKTTDGTKEIAGVVLVDIEINKLTGSLVSSRLSSSQEINESVQSAVLNQFGEIIALSNRKAQLNNTIFSLCDEVDQPEPQDRANARKMFMSGEKKGKTFFKNTAIMPEPCEIFYGRCINNWVTAFAIPSNWREKMLYPMLMKIIFSSLAVLIIIVSVIFAICKRLSRPLLVLANATEEIGAGNFATALPDCRSKDEIGKLTASFRSMQLELADYMKKFEESVTIRERTEGELNAAKAIQKDILPHILPPFASFENVKGAASLTPARGVGGDLYDIFPISDDHLAIIIGDVSGKGVPAALFMAVTQTLQRSIALTEHEPANIVTKLNEMLSADNSSNMFVTYWLGILEIKTGFLRYCNGGHNPPLIIRKSGELIKMTKRQGPPLGVVPGKKYKEDSIQLFSHDILVLYTDGVTEAFNNNDEMYGDPRLEELISKSSDMTPSALADKLKKDVFDFSNGAEQSDDITMLIVKYRSPDELGQRNDLVSFTVEADTNNLDTVMKSLGELPEIRDLPPKAANQISVSVEEIFVNIANYAYGEEKGKAEINAWFDKETSQVRIRFIDSGRPYDPLAKEDPDITLSAEERQIGGLGIFMVKKAMDFLDYEYKNKQNVFTIGKKIG